MCSYVSLCSQACANALVYEEKEAYVPQHTCGQQNRTQHRTLQSQFFCPVFPVSQGSKPGHLGLCGKHFYWLSHLNSLRSLYFNNGFKKFNELRSKNYEPPWTTHPRTTPNSSYSFLNT